MVAALRIEKGGGNQIQENLISLLKFDQFLLHRVNFFLIDCALPLFMLHIFFQMLIGHCIFTISSVS
jgi:hypothetical protein